MPGTCLGRGRRPTSPAPVPRLGSSPAALPGTDHPTAEPPGRGGGQRSDQRSRTVLRQGGVWFRGVPDAPWFPGGLEGPGDFHALTETDGGWVRGRPASRAGQGPGLKATRVQTGAAWGPGWTHTLSAPESRSPCKTHPPAGRCRPSPATAGPRRALPEPSQALARRRTEAPPKASGVLRSPPPGSGRGPLPKDGVLAARVPCWPPKQRGRPVCRARGQGRTDRRGAPPPRLCPTEGQNGAELGGEGQPPATPGGAVSPLHPPRGN